MKNNHTTSYYIKEITHLDDATWDAYVSYPVQSSAWIESRKKLGISYTKLGIFKGDELVGVVLGVIHTIPLTSYKKMSILKGDLYDAYIYEAFRVYGKKNGFAWFSFEPNVLVDSMPTIPTCVFKKDTQEFALWTTCIDTTKEISLIENNFSKVVRNESRHAIKNGLVTKNGLEENLFYDFLQLMTSTKERNGFVGYSKAYYQSVYESLKKYNQVRLFVTYEANGNPVAAALVFDFKDTLYYAYAGSLGRETPKGAMYLLVIAIIEYAHTHQKTTLDLFGCLDPVFTGNHPWKGFSQFKKAFNGEYKQYIGRYDLPVHYSLYRIYQAIRFLKNIFLFKTK